ncbi:hypothetical protein VH22019_00039 [Vibrio phage VH2_2019]|nr:hypothetical protein VH22019_00039 [Vibrio phage VH2_2019]
MITATMNSTVYDILSSFGTPNSPLMCVTEFTRHDQQDGAVLLIDGEYYPRATPDLYNDKLVNKHVVGLLNRGYPRVTCFFLRGYEIFVIRTGEGVPEPTLSVIDMRDATVASLDIRLAEHVGYCTAPVFVYKSGTADASQNGVTNQYDTLYLVNNKSPFDGWCFKFPEDPRLLAFATITKWGNKEEVIPVARPMKDQEGQFGGNFVWSTDSRFRRLFSEHPIRVHDRYEY